jgi:hypothetical protein
VTCPLNGDVQVMLPVPHEGHSYSVTAAWNRLDGVGETAVLVEPEPVTPMGDNDLLTFLTLIDMAGTFCHQRALARHGLDERAALFWLDAAARLWTYGHDYGLEALADAVEDLDAQLGADLLGAIAAPILAHV